MVRELRRWFPGIPNFSDDTQTLELMEKRHRVGHGFPAPWVRQDDRVSPARNERVEFSLALVRLEVVVSGLVYTDHHWISKWD